jgi:hypothetical protein
MTELKQRRYHSALVPILGTGVDHEAMARAARLVGPDGAVEAVYMRKVPEQPPLDGGVEQGRAIVEEAQERRSDLIYISTEHVPSEDGLLGPAIRYVLAHRPCRVIVEHDPTTAGIGRNGDGVVPAGVPVGARIA